MSKIGCYRPWTSFFVENGTQKVKPCCWLPSNPGGILTKDSTLESTFQAIEFEQLRYDMFKAEGELPNQCPIYCQHRQNGEWIENLYYDKVREYIENEKVWDFSPFDVSVTIANACNLKCKMCWIHDDFDYVVSSGINNIFEELRKASEKNLEQGLPLLDINLTGGEVFYAKPLRKTLYELANDENLGKTFKMSFITNATIWDQAFWDTISTKKSPLTHVVVSIDGHDRETYNSIRGLDKYDTVLTNLDKIIKWREEHMDTVGFFQICINSLVQTETYPHLKEIIDTFIDRDVELSFIPLIIDYKSEMDFQCFNMDEHRQAVLDSIEDTLAYINSIECEEGTYKATNKKSIIASLDRNRNYIDTLIKHSLKGKRTLNVAE